MATGQHLALDATPRLSWIRRRGFEAQGGHGSITVPEITQSSLDADLEDDKARQGRLASNQAWYRSRKQLRLLSQIAETDETQATNRASGVAISPV